MNTQNLIDQMSAMLLSFATEEGINASSRKETYGCLFGRDGAITVLQILKAQERNPNPELLAIARRTLLSLVRLQGKEVNIESGEEPGKFIHEYRREGYDHLVNAVKPWYLYEEDKTVRNYDTVDSTPLTLIAIYRYWRLTGDEEFLRLALPAVEKGLEWIRKYGDQDGDFFLEFSLHPERAYGGLT
ncbi:MAG TPA: hypothetical protein VEB60_02530, partial [Candidatus Paceibacterota bacterium]|nr:hypothetical protein [Candidatus Paceibacterota bacterium]